MLPLARTTRAIIIGGFAALAVVATTLVPTTATATPSGSLRRYPYLTDLVKRSVTVNWATTTDVSSGSVTYGRAGGRCAAHTVAATEVPITVGMTPEYQWKASIRGLKWNTSFCYRIVGNGSDLLGTDASPAFRSQLPKRSKVTNRFAVIGDWGWQDTADRNTDQANVLAQLASSRARFAVSTGDIAYQSGSQTNYGDLVQTGPTTSTVFGPSYWAVAGSSIPMFNVLGNHGLNSTALTNWPETRAANSSGGRYEMDTYCCANDTRSASYPSAWYAFDAGPVRFYILDAAWANSNVGTADVYKNDFDNHWTTSSDEYDWLEDDLEAHPGGLKFAFFHFPLHSPNATEGSDTYLTGATSLEGLLAEHGVDIVFNGHAHTYARSPGSADAPVNYVTGGGGARLQPATVCGPPIAAALGWSYSSSTHGSSCGTLPRPESIDRVFHFLLVTVKGTTVTVTPTDELGRTFDVQTYDFG
jgi:calcineurin-like phosphoesterase family protein/purple acid phosphatase-like protein